MSIMSFCKEQQSFSVIMCGFAVYLLLWCPNTSGQDCHTANQLIHQSVDAISARSTESYLLLIDFDSILRIWKDAAVKDSRYNDLVINLENDRALSRRAYAIGYNMLINTLIRIHKLEKWHFEIEECSLLSIEQEPSYLVESYIVKLIDDTGGKWSMKIYISKYNDCSFITEPIEARYLTRER